MCALSRQARSTSTSGTARASMSNAPLVMASASAGSSATKSRVDTDPCPLPTICSRAARSAADGIVELWDRRSGEREQVAVADVVSALAARA